MNVFEAIKQRKSVRSYISQAIPQEKIEAIVNSGGQAAKSGQIRFIVITNSELLLAISSGAKAVMQASGNEFLMSRAATPGFEPTYHAPCLIVMVADKAASAQISEMNTATAACAAQNMLLAATALELGSCYVVSPMLAFAQAEIAAAVGITEAETAICGVLVGNTNDKEPHAEHGAGNVRYYP